MASQSQTPLTHFLEAGGFALATMRNSMLTSQFVGFVEEGIDHLLQFVDIYPSKSKEDTKRFKYAKVYWEEDFGGACRNAKSIFYKALKTRNPLKILWACGECLKITTSGIVKFCNRYPYLTTTALATVRLALAGTLFAFAPFSTLVIAGITLGPSAFAGAAYTSLQFIQKTIFGSPQKNKERRKEEISTYTKKAKEMLTDIDEKEFTKMLDTKHQILKGLDELCIRYPELKNAFPLAEDLTKIRVNLEKNLANLPSETAETLHTNSLALIGLGLKEEQIKKLAAKEDIDPIEFSQFIDLAHQFQIAYNEGPTLSKNEISRAVRLSGDIDKAELDEKVLDTFENYRENFELHKGHHFSDQFTFCAKKSEDFKDLSRVFRETRRQTILDESFKIDNELYHSILGSTMHKLADNPIARELVLSKLDKSNNKKPKSVEIITPDEHEIIQKKQLQKQQHERNWEEFVRQQQEEIMTQAKSRTSSRNRS